MYDIRDYLLAVVPEIDGKRCPQKLAAKTEQMMKLIIAQTGEWEDAVAGSGVISAHDGVLFIRQTAPVHYEVERFINQVRAIHIGEEDAPFQGIDFGAPKTPEYEFDASPGATGC
ncbi:MAG: hypothetical protein CMJ46_09470 [Planctomyces sp.]|nr:hypothetical protein [Planctomyces sp.]